MLTYQWYRNNPPIAGADGPDHIVVAEDVGGYLRCAVTAEGQHTALVRGTCTRAGSRCASALTADDDATAPFAANAYTLRVRNDNPVRGDDHAASS